MSFCIPKPNANDFLAALKSGVIDVEKLMDMASGERRTLFASVVGDNLAQGVNAAFEEKLLLKDQQRGLITWAKNMSGMADRTKLDFIGKIRKLDRVLEPEEERNFYADFAAKKFGAPITVNEAKTLSQGAKNIETLKANWSPDTQTWTNDTDRLAYGTAFVDYKNYVEALMRDANAKSFKEWITQTNGKQVLDVANSIKGIVASLDNSFFGRQGIKTLFTNPDIWANGFVRSWGDLGKGFMGRDPISAIKADIFSRPNAMNGKYDNGKFALGRDFEEAFPTTFPERIPGLGRLYKASESAFVGGALRFRSDLADRLIAKAEAFGVDMSVPSKQAEAIGDLVNSMTGRGNIGAMSGEWTNAAFFSIRFFKSNWDTLTLHTGGFGIEPGPARSFVRRQAGMNLLKIVGSMALIYALAGLLWPESTEWDPRSSNFGKIKIGDTRFDISGGMSSLVVLAARLTPTFHKNARGEWKLSRWSKSAMNGKFTDLNSGKAFARNGLDILEDFAEGKASPFLGSLFDSLRGTDFAGNKTSYTGQAAKLVTPIGVSTFMEAMADPNAAPLVAVVMLDALGIGASTYGKKRSREAPKEFWEEDWFGEENQVTP